LHLCEVFFRVKIQMVDKKVCFLVYFKFLSFWDCYLNVNCLLTVVYIGAWIRSCANTAVLALPEVETPYLAHHFYMPGIWKPVFVFIQRKFVTIYSKVCNKVIYTLIYTRKWPGYVKLCLHMQFSWIFSQGHGRFNYFVMYETDYQIKAIPSRIPDVLVSVWITNAL